MKVADTRIIYSICATIASNRRPGYPGLVVSVSDYRTRGSGSIPGCAHIFQCIFPLFSVLMLNYFILSLVKWNYTKYDKFSILNVYIELCMISMGVGLSLTLLKDN